MRIITILFIIAFLYGDGFSQSCTVNSSGINSTSQSRTCTRYWTVSGYVYDFGGYSKTNTYNINWSDGISQQSDIFALGECRYQVANCPPIFYLPYYVTNSNTARFKVQVTSRTIYTTSNGATCVDDYTLTKGVNHSCETTGGNDDGGLECNQYCSSGEFTNNGKGVDGDLPSPFPCCEVSPIVVDVDGDGFSLTSASDGVMFDFNGDGVSHRISWTNADSDDAWLVLDRNANGTIDSSREMFGNMTEQPQSSEPHGFLALAEYDKIENGGNEDSKINNLDSIFTDLRLWQDVNHNGQSEQDELFTLGSLSVRELDLKYKKSKKVDQNGNEFRYRAKVLDTHNSNVGKWAWDVFLVLDEEENYNPQIIEGIENLKNVKFYR